MLAYGGFTIGILIGLVIISSLGCSSTGQLSNLKGFSKYEFYRVFGEPQWVQNENFDCTDFDNYVPCRGRMGDYMLSYYNYMWKLHEFKNGTFMYIRLTVEEIGEKQGD